MKELNSVDSSQFCEILLKSTPFVDVRAPIEFNEGAIPGAINLPLLNNEERAQVGICYKKFGQEKAIELGEKLVSGEVKNNRVQAWKEFFNENPQGMIYCFRGGLRSQTVQRWIFSEGIDKPLVKGGYKALRNFLLETLTSLIEKSQFILIGGLTGSGKTDLLTLVNKKKVDLEALAHHRGSAFGGVSIPQPSQIDFENRLTVAWMKTENKFNPDFFSSNGIYDGQPLFLEDESRLIGKMVIPNALFEKMRQSPVVVVEEPIETRVDHIFNFYILEKLEQLRDSNLEVQAVVVEQINTKCINAITKKLGGLRAQECLEDLKRATVKFKASGNPELHKVWIEKLLTYYYDPMYSSSLKTRDPKILFRGTKKEVLAWINK